MVGARLHLTIAEKNQLRACHRERPEMTQELLRDWVHSKFGKWVGRSTIGKITGSPDELCANQDAKRNQSGRFPDMERALFEFVCARALGAAPGGDALADDAHTVGEQSQATRPALNDTVLWTKANEILKATMGEQVSVSIGWVQRFKKRHGLHKGQKRPLQQGLGPSNALSTPDAPSALPPSRGGGFSPPVMELPRMIQTDAATSTVEEAEPSGYGSAPQTIEANNQATISEPEQPVSAQQNANPLSSLQQVRKPPMKQLASRKQFVAAEDILLLEQVLVTKPWAYAEPLDGWRHVAEVLRNHEKFSLEKSAGACQARVALLVDHARSGNEVALGKSATEHELQEKMRLLADIIAACDTAAPTCVGASQGRKRPASEVDDQSTDQECTRQRTTESVIDTSVTVDTNDEVLDEQDNITQRIARLEARLEQQLADQRENSEQRVRELSEQYQQQLEHQQRQFDQQLAIVHQQQTTIIELLKIVVERSGANQKQYQP